jgi:hypothetical protein
MIFIELLCLNIENDDQFLVKLGGSNSLKILTFIKLEIFATEVSEESTASIFLLSCYFQAYWLLASLRLWRWRQHVPPKCQQTSIRLYNVTCQEIVLHNLTVDYSVINLVFWSCSCQGSRSLLSVSVCLSCTSMSWRSVQGLSEYISHVVQLYGNQTEILRRLCQTIILRKSHILKLTSCC